MRFHWALTTIMTALMLVSSPTTVLALDGDDARLGGGSDISSAVTVAVPQGASIPAIHHIFVDNPSDEPIEVQFRADVAAGISIEPEWTERAVPAHGKVTNNFGVNVSAATAAGEYPVVVQLVRSDIEAVPGQVTNVPAIQTAFTVEVTGDASTVVVRGVSSQTGQPVSGTLVLVARAREGGHFEIDRLEGTAMETTVAPGEYRASFLLGDREVASEDFSVDNGEYLEVALEVETVAFVVSAVRATEESGRTVVVDLVASINNELPTIPGPVTIRTRVTHEGTEVDLVVLRDIAELGTGLTDAATQYRPDGGWQPGVYRFDFEMATPEFTLVAPDQTSLEVPLHRGWDGMGSLAAWDTREIVFLVAAALLGIVALERISRLLIRGLRRRRLRTVASRHARRDRRADSDRTTSTNQHVTTTENSVSWLENRIGSGAPTNPLAPAAWVNATQSQPVKHYGPNRPDTRHIETATASASPPPIPPATSSRTEPNAVASARARRVGTSPADSAPPIKPQVGSPEPAESLRTIRHLHDQGILAPDWSVNDATVVYTAITSRGFHQALKAAGMTNEDYKKVTARLLRHGLVGRPPLAQRKEEAVTSPGGATSKP